jgi:glycine cleavage system H protein
VRVGITDFAQSALGDIVYVQLPNVGDDVSAGKVFGEVESTKSVSELYAPLTGKVTSVNAALSANPEILNTDPYGQGWIIEVEVTGGEEGLLSAQEYVQLTA